MDERSGMSVCNSLLACQSHMPQPAKDKAWNSLHYPDCSANACKSGYCSGGVGFFDDV